MKTVLSPLSSHTAATHRQTGYSFTSHTQPRWAGTSRASPPAPGRYDQDRGANQILHQALPSLPAWHHFRVTGEEVLRTLADDCARNVAVAGEYKQEAMLSARPFLSGAMIALHRAKAFAEGTNPHVLLVELLAPIEQPLVDAGAIERVRFGFGSTATARATPAPEEEGER